eukprot:Pompholyxophrys_punicea_v1_NODE_405_length_2020_cov_5.457746.p2 type:complete len:138 gc:universal NODE_405_length_2020_cov_5.457746:680-1093(+)
MGGSDVGWWRRRAWEAKRREKDLSTFGRRWFSSNQRETFSRSSAERVTSSSNSRENRKRLVSSADRNLRFDGKSLTNIINSSGPSTEPWGTPAMTLTQGVGPSGVETNWERPFRYDSIHFFGRPTMPYPGSFFRRAA